MLTSCGKCEAWVLVVLGVLIIFNEWYAMVNWAYFIGLVSVVLGIKILYLTNSCKK
jgi:uncharacterized membrane protein HdeD (DUF308 family)